MGIMLPTQIVELIDRLAAKSSRSPGTVGREVGGCGDFYSRLRCGCDITTRRALRVIQRLSDRWPDDLEWPPDIPRPKPSRDSGGAA